MNGKKSGPTDEEFMEITMKYYRVKAERKMTNGERKHVEKFKYLGAETFLSYYPKFGGLSEEEGDKQMKEVMVPEINSSGEEDEVTYKRKIWINEMRRDIFKKNGSEKKKATVRRNNLILKIIRRSCIYWPIDKSMIVERNEISI